MLLDPLSTILMDSSFFLTILAAAIGFFVIFRKFIFQQENKEVASSSSSLSVSSVPPSSSSHNWTHQVFPSFRGEDVRLNILSHIQKEFQRKGITVFIDNTIERGESIGPELRHAIRESKIAIILLSKNYASSKWCLDELVEIMKCRENFSQTVMPVFYKVDPSHVKILKGDFGEVFKKTCAGKTKEHIERWRQAFEKMATIAGYHISECDNEAHMIEKIVTDVSNKLINSAPSSDSKEFVGLGAHKQNMEPFLRDSDDVRMIGILGPSGIGKSTIARFLFSELSHQFELSVFMENVKRCFPKPYPDEGGTKLQLQTKFLSQITNQEDLKIDNLGVAPYMLKDKKVLVVLDDVDHPAQLEAMAKEPWWFGPGSRIIITTQDKQLLNAHETNHIYEVGFPVDDEALQIFCMYAFGQKYPIVGFENLAREVTRLAGNLPLGLRVMGSYFKRRPEHEWENALPRLRRTSPDGEIERILQFSYDALCDEDKALFLYIACFFNGHETETVEEHLAKNLSNVKQGLQILYEKSLISIEWGCVKMHDLLARLGRQIVREQFSHEPERRQFLVDAGDICQVLRKGSSSVIGIDLTYSGIESDLNQSDGAFERMSSVQFLRLFGDYKSVDIPESLKYLPRNVRLLHWEEFPRSCLSPDFNPEFLVELDMSRSFKLEKLWEGEHTIRNLKWMNLCVCTSLVELPSSIGNAINLKELNLHCCTSLKELPSSIGNATNLKKLNLSTCTSLVELPSSIWNAINLEELNLGVCTSLKELPSSIENAINLRRLNLNNCTSLKELPSSIGNAINLEDLGLDGCTRLVKLPASIGNATNLKILDLGGCTRLVELPDSIGNATNLKILNLSGCVSLEELPASIGNAIKLEELILSRCTSLVELPDSIGNIPNLKELRLRGCSKLESLPSNINMKSLDELDLTNCSSLKSFPEISTNIRVLKLSGTAIEEIPSSIRAFFTPYSKCDSAENNLGASFNAVIRIARTKPIIEMLEEMRRRVMVSNEKRRS